MSRRPKVYSNVYFLSFSSHLKNSCFLVIWGHQIVFQSFSVSFSITTYTFLRKMIDFWVAKRTRNTAIHTVLFDKLQKHTSDISSWKHKYEHSILLDFHKCAIVALLLDYKSYCGLKQKEIYPLQSYDHFIFDVLNRCTLK